MEEETNHHQDLEPDDEDNNININDEESSSCYSSNIDTSRPFRSVKEAVEIFGERFLVGEIYSPKPFEFSKNETPHFAPSPRLVEPSSTPGSKNSSPRTDGSTLFETVKKLELELEQTKTELKSLKDKESENEVALATLNAELHRNMSRLALFEAEKMRLDRREINASGEEPKKRDIEYSRIENGLDSATLAEILSLGDKGLFKKKDKKLGLKSNKKKPIVPLVGDLFTRKKASSSSSNTNSDLPNTLYSSSQLEWN